MRSARTTLAAVVLATGVMTAGVATASPQPVAGKGLGKPVLESPMTVVMLALQSLLCFNQYNDVAQAQYVRLPSFCPRY